MPKSVRKILSEAYGFVGLSPNGVLTGRQVTKGLQFLNEVLQKYNESCLFPFSFETVIGKVRGGRAEISLRWGISELTGPVPANISAVYLRRSDTDYVELEKCEYKDIFKVRNSGSTPEWYSFMLGEYEHGTDETGFIHFDALGEFEVMVVYPRKLPELGIDDTFNAPAIYEQVLRYGVAELAAQDAGLEDAAVAPATNRLSDVVRTIKESNGSKRPRKRVRQEVRNRHARFNNPRVF
ncbi:MAG: hypothetical protein MJY87_02415 [Fibrobacter sp.]|nr:hypothetical protein [Fibrobacter sp.]